MSVPSSSGGASARRRRVLWVAFEVLVRVVALGWCVQLILTRGGLFRVVALLAAVGLVLSMVGRLRSWPRFVRTGSATDLGLMPELQGGTWMLHLDAPGPQVIHVIKVIREITGCGLRQAKEMVDNAPSVVAIGLSAEGAQRAASMLGAVGAAARTSQLPPR